MENKGESGGQAKAAGGMDQGARRAVTGTTIWHKISNASFEANVSTKFLGKPYEPNAIIKNDIEFILMQRNDFN